MIFRRFVRNGTHKNAIHHGITLPAFRAELTLLSTIIKVVIKFGAIGAAAAEVMIIHGWVILNAIPLAGVWSLRKKPTEIML